MVEVPREDCFYHAPAERPADDPILQQTVGQIASNAFAAETFVLAAADALEAASAARDRGEPSGAPDAEAALAAAKAKVVVDELAIRSAGLLFDVGGASATKRSAIGAMRGHWRRTIRAATRRARSATTRSTARRCRPRVSFETRIRDLRVNHRRSEVLT